MSDLVGNPEDRFSRGEADMTLAAGMWQDKMVISTFSYVQKQCFEI